MYLSGSEIVTRLDARFEIEGAVGDGDAELSSQEIDAAGPFKGQRQETDQEHAFPRDVNPDYTTNEDTDPPDAVLDLVALNACMISVQGSAEGAPAVVSWSRSGVSETYASPAPSLLERRLAGAWAAFRRYQLHAGRSVGSTSYPRTFESYPDA